MDAHKHRVHPREEVVGLRGRETHRPRFVVADAKAVPDRRETAHFVPQQLGLFWCCAISRRGNQELGPALLVVVEQRLDPLESVPQLLQGLSADLGIGIEEVARRCL